MGKGCAGFRGLAFEDLRWARRLAMLGSGWLLVRR